VEKANLLFKDPRFRLLCPQRHFSLKEIIESQPGTTGQSLLRAHIRESDESSAYAEIKVRGTEYALVDVVEARVGAHTV
jgi:hypothetical protein